MSFNCKPCLKRVSPTIMAPKAHKAKPEQVTTPPTRPPRVVSPTICAVPARMSAGAAHRLVRHEGARRLVIREPQTRSAVAQRRPAVVSNAAQVRSIAVGRAMRVPAPHARTCADSHDLSAAMRAAKAAKATGIVNGGGAAPGCGAAPAPRASATA